jgi:hypothetical protein
VVLLAGGGGSLMRKERHPPGATGSNRTEWAARRRDLHRRRELNLRQGHASVTEAPSSERAFQAILREVVHGVLVAEQRPGMAARGRQVRSVSAA